MTKTDFARWFAEQVQPRWPRWQINAVLLGDWFAALGGHDVTTLTALVRRHRIEDDSPRPQLGRLRALAREVRTAGRRRRPKPAETIDATTAEAFWLRVRATYSRQQRIDLMRSAIKFAPDPRAWDPEAYDWVKAEDSAAAPARPPP